MHLFNPDSRTVGSISHCFMEETASGMETQRSKISRALLIKRVPRLLPSRVFSTHGIGTHDSTGDGGGGLSEYRGSVEYHFRPLPTICPLQELQRATKKVG